ncbi:Ig-like domain repeat protein [Streptomyces sp. NPDC051921]|uniref:YncE family protein n=1 Tax=Streptomyces sp. NPDC051921 TaxID=3155806 RepID=UPI0034397966
MRKRTLSAATALAVLFSSAALVAGTAGTASADTGKVLPVASTGDIVVDGVHQKVFISDPTGGTLVVTDYAGTVLTTVPGLPGVRGLEISADSSRVYAAVAGHGTIVSVNTQTPSEFTAYDLGEAEKPADLAIAGGKIWFGYGTAGNGHVGSLDLSGAEPVVALAQESGTLGFYNPPLLGSDPAAPNLLVAGEQGISPAHFVLYDVSTGTATQKAVHAESDMSNLRELDITPDGKQVITASGSPYYHPAFSTDDLKEVMRYPSGDFGSAVDIAPDGTVAAGTNSWYGPDLHVYRPGDTHVVRQYDFPNTGGTTGGDTLSDSALAWAPDKSKLFAVSENYPGVRTLRVYDGPTLSAPVITVKAPATATRAKALTVTGTVAASVALPAGAAVSVTRFDLESPQGKALAPVTLGANGAFSFTDVPPAGGNVTYKVAYAGDAEHSAAAGTALVKVSRNRTVLTLDRNGTLVNYGTTLTYTATLGPTYTNRVVEIWADPWGPEPKRLLKRGTVNSAGKLSASMWMNRDTTVTAVFAGDSRSDVAGAKAGVYTKAGVSTSLSRHYKWTSIGGTWYQTYHQTADPLITTWHNAYPGRATRLDFQVWYAGAWRSGASDFFTLDRYGKSYVSIDGDGAAGYRFRIRSAYIDGASGDNVNATAYGPWKYFNFTR